MKKLTATIFFLVLITQAFSQNKNKTAGRPVNLLDKNLSSWYKWIGVPHTSVTGLPAGTATGDGMNGIPIGLKDTKNVFSVITMDGEKVIKASGEIYGGLTTKKEYENYHLHLQYKWGTKKWEPRLNLPRDMGIMFHLTGTNEDAFWSVFMRGLECQISEGTSADLFLVPNKTFAIFPFAEVRVNGTKNWNLNAPWEEVGANNKIRNVSRSENFESGPGKWTTIDVYTYGSSGVYLVNGHVVMAFRNASLLQVDKTTTPLTKGKIQLQSEGAEGYYKDISIQSITDIPDDIKKAAGLDLPNTWRLGVGLYTFHSNNFPEALEKVDSAGLQYVEGIGFHNAGAAFKDSLIMNLSPDGLEKLYQLTKKAGFKMESIYILGGKDIRSWKKQFEVAKHLHVKFVSAEPALELLNSIDSLAGAYGIKVAIHNHYKGTSAFWSPDSVLAALKNHPNFGVCADVGHWPKSGINPVNGLKKLAGHLIAVHFKDIAEYNNTKIKDVTVGTGVINFPEVLKELERQHFDGYIYIERDAEDKPDNLVSVNAAVKYYNNQLGLSQNRKKAFSDIKINQLFTAEANESSPVAKGDTTVFRVYNGTYKMPASFITPGVKIMSRNGDLYFKAGDYPEMILTYKKEDEFEEGIFNMQLIFLRKDGAITGVKIIFQGTESIGGKEQIR